MKRKHINTIIFSVLLAHGLSACAKDNKSNEAPETNEMAKPEPSHNLKGIAEKSFSADIDGDSKQDLIYFVLKSKTSTDLLPENTAIIQPFYDETQSNPNIKSGSKHFLYFDLSSKDNIIVQDSNEISVLDTEAASDLAIIPQKELNDILSENDIRSYGDGILLPTEAGIDLYLFWNGKSISLFEPMEMP